MAQYQRHSKIKTVTKIKPTKIMEYQVTRPAFVRTNWQQVTITFAACFAACLLATGVIYAIIYFLNKSKTQPHGNINAQTKQQRPVREKEQVSEQAKNPQVSEQKNDQGQTLESQDQEKDGQEADQKKSLESDVQLIKTLAALKDKKSNKQ